MEELEFFCGIQGNSPYLEVRLEERRKGERIKGRGGAVAGGKALGGWEMVLCINRYGCSVDRSKQNRGTRPHLPGAHRMSGRVYFMLRAAGDLKALH